MCSLRAIGKKEYKKECTVLHWSKSLQHEHEDILLAWPLFTCFNPPAEKHSKTTASCSNTIFQNTADTAVLKPQTWNEFGVQTKSAGKNTLFKSHENLQVEWWSCRTFANWAKFCYFHETLEDWLLWCFALSCLAFSSSSTLFLDAMKPFALFNTCASKPQKQWLLFVEPLQFVSEIIFLEHLQVASCFLPKMMWLAPVLDGW